MHRITGEKVAVKTFEKSKISEPQAQKRVAREVPLSLLSVVPVAAASIPVTVQLHVWNASVGGGVRARETAHA